jgi:hypothetical protein
VDRYPGPIGAFLGVIVFFVAWIYAIGEFGIFLGLGLGWFPASIIGTIAAYLWPVIVLAAVVIVVQISR